MEFKKNMFKNKRNCIAIGIVVVILASFSMFDYFEDGLYGSENIYKSKRIKIGYSTEEQSKIPYQSLWWKKDLVEGVTLNKSVGLSDEATEVYVKTGWNETKLVKESETKTTEISCYGPTLLGARLDAGAQDIDGDGKKEQVYYYAQTVINGEGFHGDGGGDEDEDGYRNYQYKQLTFDDTEKMSFGIIPTEEGVFQALFKGEPLVNGKIQVISESGLNEVVTTNVDGYFYVKDLRVATNGMNIVYRDETVEADGNVYHVLNYKVQDLDNKGIFSTGKLVGLIILIILGVLGVNKVLLEKRMKENNQLLFEMNDIEKEDE